MGLAFLALVLVRTLVTVPPIILSIDHWAVTCLLGAAWSLSRRSDMALAWLLVGAAAALKSTSHGQRMR